VRTRYFIAFAVITTCAASIGFGQTSSSQSGTEPTPVAVPSASQPALPPYDPKVTPKRGDQTGTSDVPSSQQPSQPSATQTIPQTPLPSESAPKPTRTVPSYQPYNPGPDLGDSLGSTYIPVDSWVYPAMTRLYSMGYLDTIFLGMRPWTRRSVLHSLLASKSAILNGNDEQAQDILASLLTELSAEVPENNINRGAVYGIQSIYTRFMGIGGPTLRDSYHIGQTINNDYGRPYQTGFNNITGFSTLNEAGRFSLYLRGEYQHSPSGTGYPQNLASFLSAVDRIPYGPPNEPQDTIPAGSLPAQNPFRLVEASLSFHLLGHEISGGKSDAWLGPAAGSAMAWSNNAENIYSFRINRIEPLHVPLLSKVLGPLRYDFFYGSLKGHTAYNQPYVHSEMFAFRPTVNFEFGFQRTIVFGGEGHAPVTLHTFLKGFFSFNDVAPDVKLSREDPGARFSAFNFSYRLPFVRRYVTLYADSITHDDVTPISAPRRAGYRTGLYFSQLPKPLNRLDFRVEAVSTDPGTSRSNAGQFNYWEVLQRQAYTNKGHIMGDWIGREAKGGQAWLTYHFSGREWLQIEYLNKKIPNDFIPSGTTQNQFTITMVKRIGTDVELNTWVQYEGWKAPLYKTGLQRNVVGAVQLTWYPKLRTFPERP
jgi:hypothetical protein